MLYVLLALNLECLIGIFYNIIFMMVSINVLLIMVIEGAMLQGNLTLFSLLKIGKNWRLGHAHHVQPFICFVRLSLSFICDMFSSI